MRERIEELAQQIYKDEGGMPSLELRCKVLTTAVNEAIELAARECEKRGDARVNKWGGTELEDSSKSDAWECVQCAAAIRKLKVES